MAGEIREKILAAITTKLGELSGVTVERLRDVDVVLEGAGKSLVVMDGPEEPEYESLGQIDWTMQVSVVGLVAGSQSASLGPTYNALRGDVVKKLLADPTLGGVAGDIQLGELDLDLSSEGHSPLLVFEQALVVRYTTEPDDLSQ